MPVLEKMVLWDVDEVTKVHMAAFPKMFLTKLGPRFLHELYTSFLMDPVGIAFVARDEDNTVVGVVVGPLEPRGFFKRLVLRRWWKFSLASTRAVFSFPNIIPRLARALVYRGVSPEGPPRALLSSIAVSPSAQGKGVGRMLAKCWMREAKSRGAHGCYLTTDAVNNDEVNSFYLSLGWRVESIITTPEGRKLNRYVFDF